MLKGITMINTTLCYIEKDNKFLMLHRTKKENDLNEGKWIGVGGKFEKGGRVSFAGSKRRNRSYID
jgi:hypothetical protein